VKRKHDITGQRYTRYVLLEAWPVWRVSVYDKQGNLICWHTVTTQVKAERVAVNVTRKATVSTEVTKVQHHETSL
jgi:hypothetical protein